MWTAMPMSAGRARVIPRQARAGSHPHGAVGLRQMRVRVAVVPDQSIRRIVVDPPPALEDCDAVVGTQPVPTLRVEELRVHHVARQAVLRCKVMEMNFLTVDLDPCDP